MRSWKVLDLWGIPFRIHSNWVVIFFLFSWSISTQVNQTSSEIYSLKESWLIGMSTVFFFLVLIIFVQIIHTYVCLRQGMRIKKITFYFLGAIQQTERDCNNPVGNIKISLVRPLLYFFSFLTLSYIISLTKSTDPIFINIITILSNLTLYLGLFNLLPIGVMDGGILCKSIIWHLSGSKSKGRYFLNRVTTILSSIVLILGLFYTFNISFTFGILIAILGLLGVNSARTDNQFLKIEKILKYTNIGSLKLIPLRRVEADINLKDFNELVKQNEDQLNKFYFVTRDGRWGGFLSDANLKDIPIRKWKNTSVSKFERPITEFPTQAYDQPLWKIIEALEEASNGILLIVNSSIIPIGLIDRNQIGYFVLQKLGINLSMEVINKIKDKNFYPLGLEFPKIIEIMKTKGDIP